MIFLDPGFPRAHKGVWHPVSSLTALETGGPQLVYKREGALSRGLQTPSFLFTVVI